MPKFSSATLDSLDPADWPVPSRVTVQGKHAYIDVGHGLRSVIDLEDASRVSGYRWVARATANSKNHQRVYVLGGPDLNLHRFILNAPDGLYVDHINHDTLDNRKKNLRLVTHAENDANRDGAYNTSKLGIRGVSEHQTNNADRKRYYIFRCHIQKCKAVKYFPHTPEGLEQAKTFSDEHYAAMMSGNPEPKPGRSTATGIRGLSIQNHKGEPRYYMARAVVNGVSMAKGFPFTPDGLKAAEAILAEWRT